MQTRLFYALLAIIVIGAAGFFLFPRAKLVEVSAVRRGPITQTVVATGRIAPPARIELGAQATSTVAKVHVREGASVKAGQVLVQLRDDEAEASVAQARAALVEARARVRQIEQVTRPVGDQALRQAQSNLNIAEADYARQKDLVGRGFVSQSRLDEATRTLDNARSALAQARSQAASNEKTGADYQLALSRVAQAEASLEVARARLANQVIVAPVDGTVLTRTVEAGDVAQAGRSVMSLAQAGETRIYAAIDEKNLRFLSIGFAAQAIADAYPAQPFPAEIYYIAPGVDAQRGTVEVRLRVTEVPAFVRPDMTVSIEMVVGRKPQALVVSAEAVRNLEGREPFALAAREGRAARVPLVLGLRGIGIVEIESGAGEGDQLILPRADVSEGEAVRTRARIAAAKANVSVPGAR